MQGYYLPFPMYAIFNLTHNDTSPCADPILTIISHYHKKIVDKKNKSQGCNALPTNSHISPVNWLPYPKFLSITAKDVFRRPDVKSR